MFRRILVANRGEIACRVIKTCKKLGIHSIAVASEADSASVHAKLADECVEIGPSPARESYLSIDKVIAAAKVARAEAIHPGYGFLSENPDFSRACEDAGIVFIGPGVDAMNAMALKGAAKRIAEAAGVPVIPGYDGPDQSHTALLAAAREIGWPVLLKPVAGGGGKGMKVVNSEVEFLKSVATSKREALGSCGDDTLLIERYIAAPRHVEVQVMADMAGNVLHLFERDCSTQRRHQKVLEEAPAPKLPAATRMAMVAAACDLARNIGYRGVGTVEFLVDTAGNADAPDFYFIEMNTRLQVEHPVTEMITGLDLVELQIRIAVGEPLRMPQADIRPSGHAIEARLCAEDPAKKFFPSPGLITVLDFPAQTPDVRIDTGFVAGDSVTPFYDSLIAKIIVRGADRAAALSRMRHALAACRVEGVRSNLPLLRAILDSDDFQAGAVDTRFLEKALPDLLAQTITATPA